MADIRQKLKLAQLLRKLGDNSDFEYIAIENLINQIDAIRSKIPEPTNISGIKNDLVSMRSDQQNLTNNLDSLSKELNNIIDKISTDQPSTDYSKDIQEIKKEIKRLEDLSFNINRGGNANRQIKVEGVNVLNRYTDINFLGTTSSILAADDNTNKRVNITLPSGGGGTPGGSNTQVQFNDNSAFGGDADFTWNKTTNVLSITGTVQILGANISTAYSNIGLNYLNNTGDPVTFSFQASVSPTIGWLSDVTIIAPNFKSTSTTGTAPFVVASTTKVTNLNADLVDSVHIAALTNTRLLRYNSSGTQIENATVTESSGALGGITTIGMSGQLTNTLSTGTAPFAITSTTVVTNLNVDSVDGAGVGTSGATIPLLNAANTWSGVQLFLDLDLTVRNAANTFTHTIVSAATANRTVTLPNTTGTLTAANQAITWTNGNATWTSSASSVLTLINTSTPQSFQINLTSGAFKLIDFTNSFTFLTIDPTNDGGEFLTFNTQGSVIFQTNGVNSIAFQQTTFYFDDITGGGNCNWEFGTNGTINWTIGTTLQHTLTNGAMLLKDGYTIKSGTTTGLKILDSTSQKLGFFNATPIVQPGATTDLGTVLSNLGLRAAGTAYPITTTGTVSLSTLALKAGASTGNIAKVGGIVFDHFADANNGTTAETDLYSDTLPASIFNTNGDKVTAHYQIICNGAVAATQEMRIYFGGTAIYDSGALSIGVATSNFTFNVVLIRVSSSVVRCSVAVSTDFGTLFPYSKYTEVTGLTLTNTQVLKITGQAAGAGGGSNQITAKEGYGGWESAA